MEAGAPVFLSHRRAVPRSGGLLQVILEVPQWGQSPELADS